MTSGITDLALVRRATTYISPHLLAITEGDRL